MTSEKYQYYIDFGTGFQKVELYDNKLKYRHAIEEDHEGYAIKELEGSFILDGNEFTQIKNILNSTVNKYIPLRIYRDGTNLTGVLIYNGYFNNYNNFNYNEKHVTIKQFFEGSLIDRFLAILDKEWTIDLIGLSTFEIPVLPIFTNISYGGKIITSISYNLVDVINILIYKNFDGNHQSGYGTDVSNFWYNPANATFDVKKYRIANLRDVLGFGTGSSKKLSLKRLFEILAIKHKIYYCIDNGIIRFKTVKDFGVNPVDFTHESAYLKQKVYNWGLNYKKESISFNENNTLLEGDDYKYSNNIEYLNMAKTAKEYPLSEVCTRYTEGSDNYNIDGFFFAYVNEVSHKMMVEPGARSGVNIDNGKFSPANIINDNYRDYMYCNDINFSHNGVQSSYNPRRIRNFIELPQINCSLAEPETFIESIIFDIEVGNQTIARVWEQVTDLDTDITTLKIYEFINTKNPGPPPPVIIPPDPDPVHYITVLPTSLSFQDAGGNENVAVSSDTNWTVSCAESWVTIDQLSGSGNDIINISVASSTIVRGATVIFTDGTISVNLPISQSIVEVQDPWISVTPILSEVDLSAHTINVAIVTESAWNITGNPVWMTFSQMSGVGNATIEMYIASGTVDRTGSAIFEISGGAAPVSVHQYEMITLDVTPGYISFIYNGETKSFNIITTGSWVIASSQYWCTVDQLSGTGNATIQVTCEPSLIERYAVIAVTNGGVPDNISIFQDGQDPFINVTPQSIAFSETGGSRNIDLTSNVAWSVSCPDSWVTLSTISGTGNAILTISVGATATARNSTITVTDGTIVRTIVLSQTITPVVPTIVVTPSNPNIGLAGGQITLNVVTTQAWTISHPSWIYFDSDTGSGNATIIMYVNIAALARSAPVTFNIVGALSTIYVSQH